MSQRSEGAHNVESYIFNEFNFEVDESKCVIIVPIDGCEGCIKKVVTFMRANEGHDKIIYVISSRSRKEIEMFLSKNGIENSSVLIDGGKAVSTGLVGSFPMLYDLTKELYLERMELNGLTIDSVLLRIQDNILTDF